MINDLSRGTLKGPVRADAKQQKGSAHDGSMTVSNSEIVAAQIERVTAGSTEGE